MSEATIDRKCRVLHEAAEASMGAEAADILMEFIPPTTRAEVATKADLRHLGDRLDAKIDSVEMRLTTKFESLESKFESLKTKFGCLESRFGWLEQQVDGKIETAVSTLSVTLHNELTRQSYVFVGAMVTVFVAMIGLPHILERLA
jgi:hypothetical protein